MPQQLTAANVAATLAAAYALSCVCAAVGRRLQVRERAAAAAVRRAEGQETIALMKEHLALFEMGGTSRRRDCHSAARPPLPVVGVSIVMERERQQNDSLVNGQAARR